MNEVERKKLNEMLKDNDDFIDNTHVIRDQKHSELIKLNVEKLLIFKKKHAELIVSDKDKYDELLKRECFFLFSNYPDIFSKLKDEEMDMSLMFKMIDIFREIEDGKLDQNEASYKIGKLLKEIYVDTALAEKAQQQPSKKISYTQWLANRNVIKEKLQ